MKAEIKKWAALTWRDMDNNEKHGVRFGLFPMKRMAEAEKCGWSPRDLAVALMDEAKKDGGMRA